MSNEIVIQKVRALGVADPMQATANTLKVVLAAYFTKKTLDEHSFRGYMGMLNPSLLVLMEGLKAFSLDQSGVSHKVQNTIDLAISVLRTRLERPDLSETEARETRHAILDLVREAREEANEQRILTVGLAAFATTALIAVVGGIMTSLGEGRGNGGARNSAPLLRDR